MYTVTWDEATMSSGVATVDTQHKELIKMLNAFLEATAKGHGKDDLDRMIKYLGEYATRHFHHEEQVMEQHHCPMAQQNKEAHAAFLKDFTGLAAKFEKEGASISFVMEVQQKVIHWLTGHIKGCDAKLKSCVSSKAA
jgi:hemerythrin